MSGVYASGCPGEIRVEGIMVVGAYGKGISLAYMQNEAQNKSFVNVRGKKEARDGIDDFIYMRLRDPEEDE
jgi:hypothetical protein